MIYKIVNKKLLLYFIIATVGNNHLQASDSLTFKKHTLSFVPTGIIRDWNFHNFWIPLEYTYGLNKKNYLGVEVGTIVHSNNSYGTTYGPPQVKSTGYFINLEHRFIIKKSFYYSTNLFYQHNKFMENEKIIRLTPYDYYNHTYFIFRDIAAMNAKIGFIMATKNHISFDIGSGIGIKYIIDKTTERLNEDYVQFTDSQRNEFGKTNTIKLNLFLQFKIGYNF